MGSFHHAIALSFWLAVPCIPLAYFIWNLLFHCQLFFFQSVVLLDANYCKVYLESINVVFDLGFSHIYFIIIDCTSSIVVHEYPRGNRP